MMPRAELPAADGLINADNHPASPRCASVPSSSNPATTLDSGDGMRSSPRLASTALPSNTPISEVAIARSPSDAAAANNCVAKRVRNGVKNTAIAVAANMMPVAPAMLLPAGRTRSRAARVESGSADTLAPKLSASSGPNAMTQLSKASACPTACAQRDLALTASAASASNRPHSAAGGDMSQATLETWPTSTATLAASAAHDSSRDARMVAMERDSDFMRWLQYCRRARCGAVGPLLQLRRFAPCGAPHAKSSVPC